MCTSSMAMLAGRPVQSNDLRTQVSPSWQIRQLASLVYLLVFGCKGGMDTCLNG